MTKKTIKGQLRVEFDVAGTLAFANAVLMTLLPFIPASKRKEAKPYLLPIFKAIRALYPNDPDFK